MRMGSLSMGFLRVFADGFLCGDTWMFFVNGLRGEGDWERGLGEGVLYWKMVVVRRRRWWRWRWMRARECVERVSFFVFLFSGRGAPFS